MNFLLKKKFLSQQRIRVPFMPEILKSSRSCTTLSLLGSLGSVFLTWKINAHKRGCDRCRHWNNWSMSQWENIFKWWPADLPIWAAWSHPEPSLCNVQHFLQPSWPQSASPWITYMKSAIQLISTVETNDTQFVLNQKVCGLMFGILFYQLFIRIAEILADK